MNKEHQFRPATPDDASAIWELLNQGIIRRKADGSEQWQDGYPNPDVVKKDIEKGVGHVLLVDGKIAGYIVLIINEEPAYADIEGEWLTDGDFVVYHRVAVHDNFLGQGLSTALLNYAEHFARLLDIPSLRADTNHDNGAMLHLFEKLGYRYCGLVYFRGSARRAYEKVLTDQ